MLIPHYVSHVICHVSHVTCHVSHVIWIDINMYFFFFLQSGRAIWWRVCYQQGYPVQFIYDSAFFFFKPFLMQTNLLIRLQFFSDFLFFHRSKYIYFLADRGKVRGCSTNTFVIHWLITWLSDPLFKISLRRRQVLKVEDGAFSHRIDYVHFFYEILKPEEHPNCITGQKLRGFWWMGGFCLLVELHWEGPARSLQIRLFSKQHSTTLVEELRVFLNEKGQCMQKWR